MQNRNDRDVSLYSCLPVTFNIYPPMPCVIQVKGDSTVEDVFGEINKLLASSLDKKTETVASS